MQERVTINELPQFWQEKIRSLRSENRSLRIRLFDARPSDSIIPKELRKLRRDVARYRVERNEAYAEAAALRAELAEVRSRG